MTSSPRAGCVQTMKYSLFMSSNESTFLVSTSSLWEIHDKTQVYALTVGRSASECGASPRAPANCDDFLESWIIQDWWGTTFSWRILLGRAMAAVGRFPQINSILFHFSNFCHGPSFLESESQKALLLVTALFSYSVPTVRAMRKSAGLSLPHDAHLKYDSPWYGDPNLSFQSHKLTLFWILFLFF